MKMKILGRIKKEFLNVLPAVIYFFVALNLFNLTFGRLLKEAGSHLMTFPRIAIISIIVGKIMLVADVMPFLNKFPGRPLIYNTAWKTFIYSFFGFLFIVIKNLMPYFFKYDFGSAWQHMAAEAPWTRLIVSQVWLVVLFFLFVMFRELVEAIGKDKLSRLFFGR